MTAVESNIRWTDVPPTSPGRYLWRKDEKWEPVERELVLRGGVLYTYSLRFENWVPLKHLEAGGSQWAVASDSPELTYIQPSIR